MRGGKAAFFRKLCALAAVCLFARAAVFFGADEAAYGLAVKAAQSDKTVSLLLSWGLGAPVFRYAEAAAGAGAPEEARPEPEPSLEMTPADEPEAAPEETAAEPVSPPVETSITGGEGYARSGDISFNTETGYEVDAAALLHEPLSFSLDGGGPKVLIVHTHGSEAFDPSDGLSYEPSDPWRTEDPGRTVIALGDRIADALTEMGIETLHDRAFYDYPSYAGSYERAAGAIRGYLERYPDICVVLDIHRDALMGADGTVYKTAADMNGEKCAQVLVLSGTDWAGLEHPSWRENLKLAVRLQAAMNERYPGLARPVTVSRYRYNQQLTRGSLIIEIGCNGNTLTEALAAADRFADCAAAVLKAAPA